MKTQLFIFIEGGGPSLVRGRVNKDNKDFRRFLNTLFKPLIKNPDVEITVVAEGGNSETARAYFLKRNRKEDKVNYWIVLDSDEPNTAINAFDSKVDFYSRKFIWNREDINLQHNNTSESELFLMVAAMEAWILAGINDLPRHLLVNEIAHLPALPSNLESVTKDDLDLLIKQFIRGYNKRKGLLAIQHLNANTLRSKLAYFNELATALESL